MKNMFRKIYSTLIGKIMLVIVGFIALNIISAYLAVLFIAISWR